MLAPFLLGIAAVGIAYVVVVGQTLQHHALTSLESQHRSAGPGTVVPLPPRPTDPEAPLERRTRPALGTGR